MHSTEHCLFFVAGMGRARSICLRFLFILLFNNVGSFKVIRVQLPRENPFYTDESKEEDIEIKDEYNFKYPRFVLYYFCILMFDKLIIFILTLIKYAPLCEMCGCLGPKRCSHCHQVSYCSREHQVIKKEEPK